MQLVGGRLFFLRAMRNPTPTAAIGSPGLLTFKANSGPIPGRLPALYPEPGREQKPEVLLVAPAS
jgi:hypothetical protein